MDLIKFVAGMAALVPVIYVVARLITAAYFKSKQHYERQKYGIR